MDFKTFFENNKKACIGGAAGVAVILLGIAAISGQNNSVKTPQETTIAVTESDQKNETKETGESVVTGNFYAKLNAGKPVSVLVIGDGFAAGNNLEDSSNAWAELLSAKITETFGSEVLPENLSLPSDNTVFSGYAVANQLSEDVEYDAIILSFGNYDDPSSFGIFYEGLIRALANKSPDAVLISLIEPSSVTNPEGYADDNASAIQNITDHYYGLTVDVAKLMEANGSNAADTADDDKVNQNAEGNAAVADAIIKAIKEHSENGETLNTASDALNAASETLEDFAYISASDFEKVDDTTYVLLADYVRDYDDNAVSGLLAIDYEYLPGSNDVYVTVDGNPFGRSTVDFKGTESEQHIALINDDFEPAETITVSFASADEANTFAGIIVSGNVKLPMSYDEFETKEIHQLSTEEIRALFGESEDEDAAGGPGSEETEAVTEGNQEGDTTYIDGALYEYHNGEWYEVINDDTGNPDIGVKSQVAPTRSAHEVITNKEVVNSSSAAGTETAAVEETTVAETAMTESYAETVAETAAETVMETPAETAYTEAAAAETTGYEVPVETQAASGDYAVNGTDLNGNAIGNIAG
ncbi:GDSL-like Lipase/Acylhydrolase family protein [Oribacterium sp. KHPX15]|uniref:SGNH/GDSL hydrolase family protein n=1 Tax=Oribacterium sp. KHPX15 TaxID=1855342 RepID=UPI00089A66F9|nr:SGNH/GDSL hydrolase family protein [Oribacterium sp. KHPX15]SEA52913.1 GDSL-like Lipase/Acylhydrolase family protein [Oribacterium sp. KHPX15]